MSPDEEAISSPDEEAISAEEAVKEPVGDSRPCHYVDGFFFCPRSNPQELFGEKGHKNTGTTESMSTEKAWLS